MSLSSENMLKLMAYADGELEGDERSEAEKLLATDPDSVRFVEQLGGLGELVELGYAEGAAGKAVAKFDIADAVMTLGEARRSGGEGQLSRSSAGEEREEEGAGERRRRQGRRRDRRRARPGGLGLPGHPAPQRRDAHGEGPGRPRKRGAAAPATTVASVANGTTGGSSGAGVDVSTVNSPGNSVSVFYLPTANELSTSVVVWVDETGEK